MAPNTQRGFALPLTIFLISFVSLLIAASLLRVSSDRRFSEWTSTNANALALAQSGLQTYMDSRTAPPPDGDSTRLYLSGGYTDVVAQLVVHPADTTVGSTYIVRSTAYKVDPTLGPEPRARRTLAQFARWHSVHLNIRAAFTAANGLVRAAGGKVTVLGEDSCLTAPITGLRVPGGEAPPLLTADSVNGSPDSIVADAGQLVADSTHIDWAATIFGGLVPDFTYVTTFNQAYPIQLVSGNATFGEAGNSWLGTGLLVVTGDLEFRGTTSQWNGIVLVGGRVVFSAASNRVEGLLVSGLNEQLGIDVPNGVVGGNNVWVRYNSCDVHTAMTRLSGLVPIRGGWIDNWATY